MQIRSTEAGGREHLKAEIVQSYRNCSWVFGGHGAAGRDTCDCALCDKWLNADVVQNYRAVSAGWLGGPLGSDRGHASRGGSAHEHKVTPGERLPGPSGRSAAHQKLSRLFTSLLFSLLLHSLLFTSFSTFSSGLHFVPFAKLPSSLLPFLFWWLCSFHLSYFHLFLTFSSRTFLIRSSLFSPVLLFLTPIHLFSLVLFLSSFFSLSYLFNSFGILLFHLLLSILCLSHLYPRFFYSRNLCSLFLFFSFHLASSFVFLFILSPVCHPDFF